MLQGKALLDKARSLSNRPEDQIARACGYVGPSGRVLKKSFFRALIAAKGYKLPEGANGTSAGSGGGGGKGRQAEFRTRVHGNGNLLIGQAYTRRLGLEPGQEFRIELERETGSILLLPMLESTQLEEVVVEGEEEDDDLDDGLDDDDDDDDDLDA
ncbi:MAG: AbrB family transcriptional regulator [Synechococcaceae cyanobacterium]